jgi:hypothetical protein
VSFLSITLADASRMRVMREEVEFGWTDGWVDLQLLTIA